MATLEARVLRRLHGNATPEWLAVVEGNCEHAGKRLQFYSSSDQLRKGRIVLLEVVTTKNRFEKEYLKARLTEIRP